MCFVSRPYVIIAAKNKKHKNEKKQRFFPKSARLSSSGQVCLSAAVATVANSTANDGSGGPFIYVYICNTICYIVVDYYFYMVSPLTEGI